MLPILEYEKLKAVRKRYQLGDHISTDEMIKFKPILRDTYDVLLALGPEFYLAAVEVMKMERDFKFWLDKRMEKM